MSWNCENLSDSEEDLLRAALIRFILSQVNQFSGLRSSNGRLPSLLNLESWVFSPGTTQGLSGLTEVYN